MSIKNLLKYSFRMTLAVFISRFIGLFREQMYALYFGATSKFDAFLVSFRIPNLFRELFAEGAVASVFVPYFTEKNKSEKEGSYALWSVAITLFTVTMIIATFLAIFANEIFLLFGPHLTPSGLRAINYYLPLASLYALFSSALNTLYRFFLPAVLPGLSNLVILIVIPLEAYFLGEATIQTLSYTFVGYMFTQAFITGILLHKKYPFYAFSYKEGFYVLKKMLPAFYTVLTAQASTYLQTSFALRLGSGTLSCLNYAFKVFQLPIGLLGIALSNAHIVLFSKALKNGEIDSARKIFSDSVKIIILFFLPLLFFFFLYGEQIITIIYQRGKFTEEAVIQTTKAFQMYLICLPFYALTKLTTPTLLALNEAKKLLFSATLSLIIQLVIYFFFLKNIGSLALATSLSVISSTLWQSLFIKKALKKFQLFHRESLALPVFMGFSYFIFKKFPFEYEYFFKDLFKLALHFSFPCVLYIIIIQVLRKKEIHED